MRIQSGIVGMVYDGYFGYLRQKIMWHVWHMIMWHVWFVFEFVVVIKGSELKIQGKKQLFGIFEII